MDFEEVRRIAIIAMFSDDVLFEKLTLKGGNALRLVHGIGGRASIDLDLSIEEDFDNTDDLRKRIFRALTDRFDSAGYIVFDQRFFPRPSEALSHERWGGYDVEFKLISEEKHRQLRGDLDKIRIQSETVGPNQLRRFKIQLSKYEYCKGRTPVDLDDYTIYVYTPAMIAIEKLRAICQQMPDYERGRANPAPRARDFYDIFQILQKTGLDLSSPDNLELFRSIFSAKEVPLHLLARIPATREFHRGDWPAVEISVSDDDLRAFDFYFDQVVAAIQRLKSLWVE